ncbi:fimbrial assembly protein [Bdellovibrio bacteriovorus W]|nr:fimbrial assembly protein [Bdellovibrio bacteriovorus W]
MKGFIRLLILSSLLASLTSCVSQPIDDDDFALEDMSGPAKTASSSSGDFDEDFADFEESDSAPKAQANNSDMSIEDEFSDADVAPPSQNTASNESQDPFAGDDSFEDPFANNNVAEAPQADIPSESSDFDAFQSDVATSEPAPEPAFESTPSESFSSMPAAGGPVANITDLQFKSNEAGGTVIVRGDQPLHYVTRSNPDLRQFIIEVDNVNLPDRLKRSLNTRDIKGSVGAIDAYQSPGSTIARFVIQLREGVEEPAVQIEGNSLLIVANGSASSSDSQAGYEQAVSGEEKILPSQNLTEFLAGNTQFYGKKISIETNNMDIRDALNFITEESGVNMVISEDVRGNVSLKLRQVPWDQALVVLMQSRKLGYTRQGNVLRIAPLQDLKAEEDDATKLQQARKNIEPLKVRMFPVSYARVEELEKKIKDFLGDRGRVVGDVRTNSLVVTDIDENIERAAKLIASLDTQPPQVLIESKIVEAQESFTRNIGINWGATGAPIKLGNTARGPVNMNPAFNINPTAAVPGNLNFNVNVGTLDLFGTLQAALSLSESQGQVKILSAPRIMTMSNEKADINQTTEEPVRQVTQNGTATQETFQFKPLTLKLEVTPQVTADASVIMKVTVNRQFRGADVSSAGQGAFAVNSREANTRVLVKNGQTAVIGGIYQSDAVENENGVPWFRELPIVSYLFKTKNVTRNKSELLVFLTPRIIGPLIGSSVSPETQDF